MSRWSAAFVAAAVAALSVLVAVAGPATGAMNKAFSSRFDATDRGDILLRGNSLVSCPVAETNCPAAKDRSATGGALNNNSYTMQFLDVDGTGNATNSSSSAEVTLPAGASVRFAGLYWSAYADGNGRTAAPAGTAKNRLLLKVPNESSYREITAAASDVVDGNPSDGTSYVSFADVTSIVAAGGSGTYTGADIHAATGQNSYAAWTLVVVVRDPAKPLRKLKVFDGFGTVQNTPSTDRSVSIPLTGLTTADNGTAFTRLGAVVFEGDAGLTGEGFQITPQGGSAIALSDGANPANNVFNSTNTDAGTPVAGRVPNEANLFGFDADVFEDTSIPLGNNVTQATLDLTTGGETFFPAVATFVSNVYLPVLDVVRDATVVDVAPADGRTRPGDQITYTVDVTNTGTAASANTRLADLIPPGTAYVPNSLRVDGNPVPTTGEVTGDNVTVRLGTGATASAGGALAIGATTRITYTVQITAPFTAGGTVGGTSQATYEDAQSTPRTATSAADPITVTQAQANLTVTQTFSPSVVQKSGSREVTMTTTVNNIGPETETAAVLVETFPAGTTAITATGATCTTSNGGLTLTCPIAASLAAGGSATVTFKATLPANAPDPTAIGAAVSGAATDATQGNNSVTTNVPVNTLPTAVDDMAPLNTPATTVDVDVLANDTDPDPTDLPAARTITSTTTPAHGTTSVVGGKVRYTLTDPSFVGTDTFQYTMCDGRGGCDTGSVDVAVNDHRRADLKVTQTASPTTVQRDGTRLVTWSAVVSNTGPQNEPAAQLVQVLPAGVTAVTVVGATCNAPTGTTYTCPLGTLNSGISRTVQFTATLPATAPDPSTGTATLSGQVPDPDLSNNTATTPVAVNRAPQVAADTPKLAADVLSSDLDVTANDQDPDGDPLTITTVSTPAHGTATIVGGKIRYTLTDHSFVGPETLTYRVCDGRGGCSDATVTLDVADHEISDLVVTQTADPKVLQRNGTRKATWTVNVRNDGPEANAKPVVVQTLPAGVTEVTSSLAACTVADTVKVTCPMAALKNGESAQITFTATLPADAKDPSTASAVVSSSSADPVLTNNAASASVVVNTPPTADDESVPLPASTLKATIDVLEGDQDADSDPLTLDTVGKPAHGTAAIVDGKIVYTLTDPAFAGDDTFTYRVCDDRSGCTTAEVTVAVAAHQRGPVAAADSAGVVTGNPVTVDVTANDRDPDGDPLTLARIVTRPTDGTARIVDGKLVYTPAAGFIGKDTVRYEVCDPTGLCDQAVATIRVTAAPPTLKPDAGTVRPGGTTVVDVLDNDLDPNGYPIGSLSITQQPAVGTATVGPDGTIRYKAPASVAPGTVVAIRYRACNRTGACSEGVVRLKVGGAPVSDGDDGDDGSVDPDDSPDGGSAGSPAGGDDDDGELAFTGSRVLVPLTVTALVLIGGGVIVLLRTRGGAPVAVRVHSTPVVRRAQPRGRHKA
ncbi:Ig-like domain-containing protein [Kineosporia sp. NBRC 101677]|uniref:Ig-like domain-containing protein n=1 Tax=Kineosporia sp. NBRC 101677 TaxID=3032197 RepID=UPI002555B162|nr:Ig-like domain-containing protein [Kineosporia sp. NBRC 101677]